METIDACACVYVLSLLIKSLRSIGFSDNQADRNAPHSNGPYNRSRQPLWRAGSDLLFQHRRCLPHWDMPLAPPLQRAEVLPADLTAAAADWPEGLPGPE